MESGITSEITISLSPLILLPSQSTHAQVYFLLNSKVLPPTYVHKGLAGLLSLSFEGRPRRPQKVAEGCLLTIRSKSIVRIHS